MLFSDMQSLLFEAKAEFDLRMVFVISISTLFFLLKRNEKEVGTRRRETIKAIINLLLKQLIFKA